eukprot:TRINITY_DN3532_c0_g1_i1.p1 TRINITY_DN3532_c0_g1~~TRINITY_DN3532_c0_g1_i1.p1  ORF type:complete len:659 (+),score=208.99 TRINITY_DN3532_c0_g1_i1:81-2057(+)
MSLQAPGELPVRAGLSEGPPTPPPAAVDGPQYSPHKASGAPAVAVRTDELALTEGVLLGLSGDAGSPVEPLSAREITRDELAQPGQPLDEVRDQLLSKEGGDVAYSLARAVRKEEGDRRAHTTDPSTRLADEWRVKMESEGITAADGGTTLPTSLSTHGVRRTRVGSLGHQSGLSGRAVSSVRSIYEGFAGQDLRDESDDSEDEESLRLVGDSAEPQAPTGNSNFATFLTLVKAFVGPAHLYLAKAFAHAGVWTGMFGLAACCALNGWCVTLLVSAQGSARELKREEIRARVGRAPAGIMKCSFAEVGRFAFQDWNGGRTMYALVEAALVASQLGLVTMYFIFIAQTLIQVFQNISDCESWATDLTLPPFIFGQAILQMPMALLRHLEQISFFAIVADVLILSGMIIVIVLNSREIDQSGAEHLTGFQGSTISLFLGTAILTFEGIGLMLPIRDAMADDTKFVPLMTSAMTFCVVIFTVFALLGYMARGGDDVETNLLLALPRHNVGTQMTQILYSLAVLLTFPLQAFPAYRIVEIAFKMRSGKDNFVAKWRKNGLRIGTVLVLACVAWGAGSHLENFVSILGGLTMCPLAFVFPSLFHLKLCAKTQRERMFDTILAVGGIIIVFFVTGMAVKDWITGSSESDPPCIPSGHNGSSSGL